jgi:hypothetical protein
MEADLQPARMSVKKPRPHEAAMASNAVEVCNIPRLEHEFTEGFYTAALKNVKALLAELIT